MNWTVAGPLIVAILAGVFALAQAKIADRRAKEADQSATTTKTIEIGVTELINQYRAANEELRDEVHEVTELKNRLERKMQEELRLLRAELAATRQALEEMTVRADNFEAENVRLRIKAGEV